MKRKYIVTGLLLPFGAVLRVSQVGIVKVKVRMTPRNVFLTPLNHWQDDIDPVVNPVGEKVC